MATKVFVQLLTVIFVPQVLLISLLGWCLFQGIPESAYVGLSVISTAAVSSGSFVPTDLSETDVVNDLGLSIPGLEGIWFESPLAETLDAGLPWPCYPKVEATSCPVTN